jgi:hypothetical protein
MRRTLRFFFAWLVLMPSILTGLLLFGAPSANAAYNSSMLISDNTFSDTGTMGLQDIQNFLNSKNSGIKNYYDVENCNPPTPTSPDPYAAAYYPHCGYSVSAAVIIYDAAHAYGINPRVLLATMQKEQSLITTPNPSQSQINCAMGYNSCGGFSGFFSQVDNGAWALRTYVELMNGRNWWGYTPSSYPCKNASSLYSTGLYPGRSVTFANPGGQARTVTLGSSATAALYCYTPHVGPYSETGYSGSYNFVVYFELWFGSTIDGRCVSSSNLGGVGSGTKVIPNRYWPGEGDRLSLAKQNDTGSTCTEIHTWQPNQQSWYSNIATNLPVANPSDGEIISGNIYGDLRDEVMYVKYRNTGSGNIEVHTWQPGYQGWYSNIATNLPSADADNGYIVSGDTNNDGRDELMFIKVHNTGSGNIEVHTWQPGQQSWASNIATNLPNVDSANGYFISARVDGRDRLMFVKTQNTGSGNIEIHIWNPDEQTWYSHIATNVSSTDAPNGKVIGINDSLAFVKYTGTGSGRIEVHTWQPGEHSWASNIATNY